MGHDQLSIRLDRMYHKLLPHLTYGVYVNLPSLTLDNYLWRYYLCNLPRLVEIKRKYDPDNVFTYAQAITTVLPPIPKEHKLCCSDK